MIRRPPRSTRTDTRFPYTTLLRSVRTGQEYLRPARFAAHRQDDRADAVADAHQFARNLLVAADHALGAAAVDDDVAELDRLYDAGRSEERRVGQGWVSKCIFRGLPYHLTKKEIIHKQPQSATN